MTIGKSTMSEMAEQLQSLPDKAGFPRIYSAFLASAAGIITVLLVLGFEPTQRMGGPHATLAMLVGCLISFLAALVGTLPVILARGKKPVDTIPALLVSMVARLSTALLLLLIAGLNSKFAPLMNTMVVWLVISHAVLLVAEIRFARRALYVG